MRHISDMIGGTRRKGLTLRRFGWQAGDDGGQYVASCYHELRYRQARESRQRDIRGQQRGRLEKGIMSDNGAARLNESQHTWCTSTNSLSVVALLKETMDTTDGELETSLC